MISFLRASAGRATLASAATHLPAPAGLKEETASQEVIFTPRPSWPVGALCFLLAAMLTLALTPSAARADDGIDYAEVVAIIYDRAEAYGLDGARMVSLARCESRLDPRAVGQLGELGLFQLAPFGLLPLFARQGYSDALDPWEAADFASWAISRGMGAHWSCW